MQGSPASAKSVRMLLELALERTLYFHPRPCFRLLAVTAAALCALPLHAQPNHPWTVPEIWGTSANPTGNPPGGMVWSPDGKHVTWIGDHGNLMEIEPPSTKPEVLLPGSKIDSLLSAPVPERDRDHRARYGEPDYIWSPDSRHILFDTDGELWLFDLGSGTGVRIGNTGMASGDDPKFSPNGQFVSFLRNHNLYVLPADGSRAATALTGSRDPNVLDGGVDWVYLEELDARSNYFWSPDSRQIAFLQMNETEVPEYPLTDWIPVHAKVHEQRYPQPGDPNPGVRVGIVPAGGGSTRWLHIPLQEGDDYIPRFGWVNSRVVWVETLSRNQQHLDLWFADPHTGQIALVLAQSEPKYFNTTYDVRFVGDNQFLILSWRDGHTHIYRYTFNPGDPMGGQAQLADQLESGNYEVETIAGVDADKQTVWYLSNQDHPRQEQIWAVQLDSSNRHQISQGAGVHHPEFAPRGGHFIDTYSSMMDPPAVAACEATGDCTPFWKSAPLHGHKLIAPVLLKFTAADSMTTLYGTLLLPPHRTQPRSVPLIVNPYGGPDVGEARDAWGGKSFYFDQLLAEHGFAVLHVDNRGMGGRGRAFEQVCFHNFGPPQFADQMAAIDQVLPRYPQLDPRRLGWWGWSWGGSFTLFALSHSDSFLAGVSVAPVTDWRNYDSIYTERYMGLPSEDADNYTADSDVTSAANLHGRILIMHGTGDDNVHIENTIQYIEQLIKARIPYDLNLFPRKTHSIAGPDDRTVLFEKLLDHFESYLMNPQPGEGRSDRAQRDRHR
jgi:dipeptidyl-peptidase-4